MVKFLLLFLLLQLLLIIETQEKQTSHLLEHDTAKHTRDPSF